MSLSLTVGSLFNLEIFFVKFPAIVLMGFCIVYIVRKENIIKHVLFFYTKTYLQLLKKRLVRFLKCCLDLACKQNLYKKTQKCKRFMATVQALSKIFNSGQKNWHNPNLSY